MSTTNQKLFVTLRIAAAMCFIGHGAFGIITKAVWVNYFGVFGIGHDMAYRLMPVLGSVDILMGLSLILYPTAAVAGWLVIWGLVTAALRPLSGEPFGELVERAGNYGAPLCLLLLTGIPGLFRKLEAPDSLPEKRWRQIVLCLRVTAFLLLLGHGWLNLIGKKGLLSQYASIGFSDPALVAKAAGIFEVVAALAMLIRPLRGVVLIILLWKMASELFYPHWEIFEWVERGGSYGVLLALWFCLERGESKQPVFNGPAGTANSFG